MRIIGLTGGIACGKSTVSAELKRLGCYIIDGDKISHELTSSGGEAIPSIRHTFGPTVMTADGALDREAMGRIVFSDSASRNRLNQIMAPLILSKTQALLQEARSLDIDICVLDMPLLFEQHYDSFCDAVWCVWLPLTIQIERLMKRNGISEQEALQRINASMPVNQKAEMADVVIDNSDRPEIVLSRLPAMLNAEKQIAVRKRRRALPSDSSPLPEAPADSPPSRRPLSSSLSSGLPPSGPFAFPQKDRETPANQSPVYRNPASSRKPAQRKVEWKYPLWLLISLASLFTFLLCLFTAHWLMLAYLKNASDTHTLEQQHIDASYPLLYRDTIESQSEQFNLRPSFVASIIMNESSFRSTAESGVGARGLMQLMPDTAEWIAHKLKMKDYAFERMFDPESNIRFGCWYLNYLSSLFRGDPVCVACAYHAGQGQVTSWLSNPAYAPDGHSLQLELLPDGPTKEYAREVIRDYGIYEKKYFSENLRTVDEPYPDPSSASSFLFIQCQRQSCDRNSMLKNDHSPSV